MCFEYSEERLTVVPVIINRTIRVKGFTRRFIRNHKLKGLKK